MALPRASVGLRVFAALLGAVSVAASSRAQAPAPPPAAAGLTASELNPGARLPRPAPRDADIFAPEPPGPCPLAGSDVQVTLRTVTFRGATALSAADLAPAYTEYVGVPRPVAVICTIRDRAARALFDQGVLARVEIPEQRISDGALVLEVIEAKVVNVRVRGDIGPAQGAVERYVEKLRGMSPFDMRKAQRYILLASDIPGVRVRAAIRPSVSAERGAVDVDVSVTRDALDVVGGVQNTGSKTVGRWGGLVRADLQSQTQYGERSSLVGFRTLEANEQWVVQALEEARFGGDGLIGRASAVYGESRPGGALKGLGLVSRSAVGGLEAAYPLVRLRRTNLNLAGGVELVDQKTSLAGAGRLSTDKLRIGYVRADGDWRTWALGRPVQFDGALTLRRGVSGLGASKAGSPLLSRGLAQPDAWLVRGSGGLETVLTDRLSAVIRVQGQYTDKALFAYEQLTLGNLSIGRGYDPAAVLGDSGVSAGFELRHGAFQPHPKIQAAPFVFYDVGYVHNNNNAPALSGLPDGRTLQSVGAGVNMRVAGRANLALTYAHPLDSVAPGFKRAGDRFLVRLTASFQ